MLREIRKITSRAKANYLRRLQKNGKIGKHINSKGYVCYDSEELSAYRKTAKKGRPAKITNKGE